MKEQMLEWSPLIVGCYTGKMQPVFTVWMLMSVFYLAEVVKGFPVQ